MRRVERVRDLDAEINRPLLIERPAAHALAERLSLEQLHHDELLPACSPAS